jgi:hypothetical protein
MVSCYQRPALILFTRVCRAGTWCAGGKTISLLMQRGLLFLDQMQGVSFVALMVKRGCSWACARTALQVFEAWCACLDLMILQVVIGCEMLVFVRHSDHV